MSEDGQTANAADENVSEQPANGDEYGADENARKAEDGDKQEHHSRLPLIIGAGVVVVAIILFGIYYLLTRGEITTDDAYTDGRAISIAANISGYVTRLNINDNTFVHAGDVLLIIDPRADTAAVLQAKANLALVRSELASAEVSLAEERVQAPAQLLQAKAQLLQAEAQRFNARRNYIRQHTVDPRASAASALDQATEQLRAADAAVAQARAQVASASLVPQMIQAAEQTVSQRHAQVAQAAANLAEAQVKLSYNTIRAPQDGWITMRNVELGTYVQAGQQVFYIVTPQVWITANFKEDQLTHIRPGDRVDISVDAYPSLHLHGRVQSIQMGSGARFSEFPAENATGNFVKIVRRVPVKIVLDNKLPGIGGLPLGISVEPTVYVK